MRKSDYLLVGSKEFNEVVWRAKNPWDERLPEVKDWNSRIRGR